MTRRHGWFRVTAIATIAGMVFALVPFGPGAVRPASAATTPVFINEIHYDNAGTDAGEAVEIAGPAGTDLTGWSLVLYNGANGLSYGASTLSGVIPDQQGGYGTVFVLISGLQNGSPDGIALVDGSSVVVQFLSYEGTFVAGDGPAAGMTSVDIGVAEGSSTPIGDSLQLTGTGSIYEDFGWSGPSASTFGAVNTGQTFGESGPTPTPTPVPTEPPTEPALLVINEIDYDQPGTDAAEFVEIKNVGADPVDLSTISLVLVNGTGSGAAIYNTIVLPAVSLASGDYFVVCGDAAIVPNCDLDVSPDTNLIQNGAPDAVGLRDGAVLIDAVSYEGDTGAPYTEGSGAGLEDDPGVDQAGISRFPDGADTDVNNVDLSLRCSTPGEANEAANSDCVPTGPASPVINEFSASTTGTDVEYVEVFGDPSTDYSIYTILEIEGDGTGAGVIDEVIAVGSTDGGGLWLGSLPANALENGTISLLLVENFTGTLGNDLDADNDGVLDSTPWTALVDAVSVNDGGSGDLTYGVPALGPNYDGLSSFPPGGASRIPDGFDTDAATDWARNDFDLAGIPGFPGSPIVGEALNTPGEPNALFVPPPEACGDPFTPIYAIQGSGSASPLDGTEVATEGIVVGDFQDVGGPDQGDLRGFHLQDPFGDGDPATSDGIFVFAPGSIDVAAGDLVRVRGTVDEFFDLTEITGVSLVLPCGGTGSVAPTALSLPVSDLSDFEPYEGMLVTFAQSLFISEYFNFDRFGEIVLTGERQFQPTAVEEPGSPEAAAVAAANALSRIMLDDGRSTQNPDPALHPNGSIFDLANRFRGGDRLQNVTGILDYSFGLYRIQPTQGADYFADNSRSAGPEAVGGGLRVASFNVLNYFTTIDTGGAVCGPPGFLQGCRGADDANELARQRAKIIAALAAMDADIVGLIEIQNDAGASVIDLVAGLNDVMGPGTYAYVGTGFIGTDAIKQALIYQPASVTPIGAFALLDSSVDPRFDDDRNRPALAQTFQDSRTGGLFTVVINHLKSKGSGCGPGDDDPVQGNCNLTRTLAAQALVDWLATDPTGSGSPDFLILGDLNAYDKEDPIDAIRAGADGAAGTGDDWTDLVFAYQGENAYSYMFDGQLGYLDHGLASPEMVSKVTGATIWHINADEPDILDYDTSFKKPAQDALYEPNAYRSSDHDPVIVGLNVCEITPPEVTVQLSPAQLWPANHKVVDVTATVTAADNWDPNPLVTLLSVVSNEPDNGLGDGDTPNDIVIVDDFHFQLRAERSGTGQGRSYTVTYLVTDACGNTTIASGVVTVPKSQGKN